LISYRICPEQLRNLEDAENPEVAPQMVETVELDRFLELKERMIPLDVRSPVEFGHSHVPGSVNVPLFSDDERAAIGWTYKHKGQREAVLLGESYAQPKIPRYLEEAEKHSADGAVLVLCARGGMRSGRFSDFLSDHGFSVFRLEGGYKSYRRHVLESFREPLTLVILAGKTGCGKTEILEFLTGRDEQVLDMEALAGHKGSAFGSIGSGEQPSTEFFENSLFEKIRTFRRDRRIWVEDESLNIGKIFLPEEFYDQMKASPQVMVQMDREIRISRLCRDYGQSGSEPLKEGMAKIRKRLGMEQYTKALEALDTGIPAEAASIVLHYYDKCYDYSMELKNRRTLFRIDSNDGDTAAAGERILDLIDEFSFPRENH